jgi:hypothetical protein
MREVLFPTEYTKEKRRILSMKLAKVYHHRHKMKKKELLLQLHRSTDLPSCLQEVVMSFIYPL